MESTPPLRSRETVADALAQAQVQLAAARSATDRLTGQLHAMGDPDGLRASAESLQSQTGQLQEEYDALRLAMDTLAGANTVDRKSTRLNSSHPTTSRMPSSA